MWVETTKEGRAKYVERYTDPMTGKTKRVTCVMEKNTARNRRDALRILTDKIESALKDNTEQKSLTLYELKKLYLDDQSAQLKLSTLRRTDYSIDSSLRIIGGDVLLDKLTAGYIRTKMIESGCRNSTINNYLKNFKAMIRWAYNNDYISNTSMIDKLQPFKEDGTKKEKLAEKYLEKEELASLIDAMKVEKWRVMTRVLALSGMRIGELIALEVTDVDFTEHTIRISKTYDMIDDVVSAGAKTDTSNRVMYMQPQLEEAMRLMRAAFCEDDSSVLYICGTDGSYVSYSAYNKYLRKYSALVLGRSVTPHALRHTHVALLAENGMPLEEISYRLGHANSSITRDVYFHVTKKLEEQRKARIMALNIL